MKRILLIALLLLGWSSTTALADYDARKSEAMSQLDKAEITDDERRELKEALDRYFSAREDCLEALVGIVAKEDEGEQDAMFVARTHMCASGGAQILGDGLDDIKEPTIGALGFLNVFASHESAFYQSLAGVTAAEARDHIVTIRIRLAGMTEVLDEKWETILDQDETLDERAKKMAQEIRSDLDTVIKEAAEGHKDAAELIADGIKKYAESPTAPTPKTGDEIIDGIISIVKSSLGPLIATWQATSTRGESRVRAYRSLFTSERRVLVMFEEVRDDVKEFLEDNDFPRAEKAYATAKSSLDSFVSSAKTSGQSSDASELRGDLVDQLAAHLKDAADVYGTFVGKHKEKFFGALGPNIKRELVEPDAWEDYADFVEGYGLDAKLRSWQDNATNYFGVDLGRLPNDHREQLKTGLRAIVEDLIDELKAAGKTYRDVQVVIEDEREDVEDELD